MASKTEQLQYFDHRFDALVDKTLKQWHVPSVSFAITDRSSTHTKCYGLADVKKNIPADDKTLHYIASLTKAHLSAAWAIYIFSAANQAKPEHERITWRTPIAQLIPDDFQLSDPARTNEVTLEDALSHRTGLPRHDASRECFDIKTTKALTRNLRNLPFHNPLRVRFEYCNVMFVAASHALETVTGKPLATVLREWLWEPMGMDSTYAGDSEAAWTTGPEAKTIATGYAWSKPRDAGADVPGELEQQPHPDLSVTSGAGYAISTVSDYIKWMQGLLGITETPLSDDIVHNVWTARSIVHEPSRQPPCEGLIGYALGWFIAMYRGQQVRWHSGGLAGAGSLVVILPDLQWGVTYFANAHDVSASLKGLAFELVDIRLGVPEQERYAYDRVEACYLEGLQDAEKEYATALTRLFPGAAAIDTNLPDPRYLERHSGQYFNPGYGRINVLPGEDGQGRQCLLFKIETRTPSSTIELHPLTGTAENSFLVTLYGTGNLTKTATRAQSRINADGEVEGIGIAMEPAIPTTLLQFDRIRT